MDFSIGGDRDWNRDQIGSNNIMNYNMSDIFMTAPKIDRRIQWPPIAARPKRRDAMYKVPYAAYEPPPGGGIEGFSMGGAELNDSTLIMFLLVILIVMCAMTYNVLRQVRDLLLIRAGA